MSQRITSSAAVQNLRQTHLTLEIHSLKLDLLASVISPYSQTWPAWVHRKAYTSSYTPPGSPMSPSEGPRKGTTEVVGAKSQRSPLMEKSNEKDD